MKTNSIARLLGALNIIMSVAGFNATLDTDSNTVAITGIGGVVTVVTPRQIGEVVLSTFDERHMPRSVRKAARRLALA